METQTPLVTWSAPAKQTYHRSKRWYIVAGTLAFSCGLGSILWGAWSVTVVTILLVGVYFLVHRVEQPVKTMSIFESGYRINRRFVPWVQCEGFWILEFNGHRELHIGRKGGYSSDTVIQIGELDPETLMQLLGHFIPHLPEKREKLIDALIRICQI